MLGGPEGRIDDVERVGRDLRGVLRRVLRDDLKPHAGERRKGGTVRRAARHTAY